MQSNCGSDTSSVQSGCGAFVSCYEGCQCSDVLCIQNCESKVTGSCASAYTGLENCLGQHCSSPCGAQSLPPPLDGGLGD